MRSLFELLRQAGRSFGVLSKERCTGDPAKRTGNEYMYQELAGQNIEDLKAAGVKKIVTSCPHCVKTIGHDYRMLGYEVEIVHSASLIEELTRHIRLDLETENVTYHDPCYLGRYADTHEEPRALLARFGADVKEPVAIATIRSVVAPAAVAVRGARKRKRISQERSNNCRRPAPARW
jgi:Fe-S oxidoreductase